MKRSLSSSTFRLDPQMTCVGAAFLFAVVFISISWRNFAQELDMVSQPTTVLKMRDKGLGLGWVEIDFGNGTRRLFQGELRDGAFFLRDILPALASEAGLSLRLENGYIREIGGIARGHGSWNIYQNARQIKRSLAEVRISAGDKYTLRYEK